MLVIGLKQGESLEISRGSRVHYVRDSGSTIRIGITTVKECIVGRTHLIPEVISHLPVLMPGSPEYQAFIEDFWSRRVR